MSGDLLDLILIALAAAFAVAGYRQGFIIGVMSFVGFAAGAVIGIYVAPGVATALTKDQSLRAVLAIVLVFSAAVVGMLITSALGVMLRSKVRHRSSTVLDSIGGAIVNIVAILMLAWLIGSLVAYAPPFPAIQYQVNNSLLLKGIDRLVPEGARPEFSALQRLLSTEPYVQVFGALGAETALNVPKPDQAVLRSPGLVNDRNSVVKIEGVAPSCSRQIEGSGFVIGPDHVVTNAHVVAGVRQGPQVYTRTGSEYPARVVLFDPSRDIAVLYVPDLNLPALRIATSAPFGAQAVVAGYPLNSAFTAVPARVGRSELADGPDIYDQTHVIRDIYPIRALVRPGNSGGPLIAPHGQVYGMVFAAAVAVRNTGYALTGGEILPDIRRGLARSASVSTEACQ
ncbi:MAG TPA: MarP family serine protease [Streptosporangiaceae bacterium]|nr:MarP family serine protease [Streptosporangiaceae bacterium]